MCMYVNIYVCICTSVCMYPISTPFSIAVHFDKQLLFPHQFTPLGARAFSRVTHWPDQLTFPHQLLVHGIRRE